MSIDPKIINDAIARARLSPREQWGDEVPAAMHADFAREGMRPPTQPSPVEPAPRGVETSAGGEWLIFRCGKHGANLTAWGSGRTPSAVDIYSVRMREQECDGRGKRLHIYVGQCQFCATIYYLVMEERLVRVE